MPTSRPGRSGSVNRHVAGWLLAAPLAAVLAVFLVLPIVMIVVVSFWGATEFSIYPGFLWDNYQFLLGSEVTWRVFLNTFKYAAIPWVCTLLIGFTVAYFLAFLVRTLGWLFRTLFIVVPIFNTMMRIDRSLLEAAADSGASGWL